MTGHTRTDGLPEMARPPQELPPESTRPGSAARLQCHACPVLCQIAPGRAGACDRYANRDGALVRLAPLGLLRKTLDAGAATLVPFAPRRAAAGAAGGADASADTAAPWSGDLLHADDAFLTPLAASTTSPPYTTA